MAWIEIGTQPVCIGFNVRAVDPAVLGTALPSLRRGEDDWKTISQSLAALHTAGVQIGWGEFHSPFERACGVRLLDLPTYAWNNKNHWIQYNGDWALTKGNTCYDAEKKSRCPGVRSSIKPSGCSSLQPADVTRSPGCRRDILWLSGARSRAVRHDAGGLLGRGMEPSDERSGCSDTSE